MILWYATHQKVHLTLAIVTYLEFSRIKKEVFYTQQCVYKCVNTQVLLIADDWMGKVNFLKEKTRNKSLY